MPQSVSELEDHRKFLENRAKFPLDELARRAGRWIAWSPDGARIVAESEAPEALDPLVRDAGGVYHRSSPASRGTTLRCARCVSAGPIASANLGKVTHPALSSGSTKTSAELAEQTSSLPQSAAVLGASSTPRFESLVRLAAREPRWRISIRWPLAWIPTQ